MQITVNGLDDIRRLADLAPNTAREVIRRMAAIAYDAAEVGARAHSRPGGTGALLQSLYNRERDGGPARAVGHDPERAPHALFVNLGTKPHVIEPKNKKALRWASGGFFHFAARVNHPGNAADPYIYAAGDAAIAQFRSIVDQALKEAAQ